MSGRKKLGRISEPEFDHLLQALSSTTKGRSFLEEYRRRCQPAGTLSALDSLRRIEATAGEVREQLRPERIAEELQNVIMSIGIAIEGAEVDPNGSENARRLALIERARRELAALARGLSGEVEPSPKEPDQPAAAESPEER